MPQLDIATYLSQIVWLFLTFGTLYFIMARMVLPSISNTVQSRDERITSDLDQAESLKIEAEKLEEEYLSTIKSVRKDASEIIAEAHKKVKDTADKKSVVIDEEIAAKQAESEQAFASKRQQAYDEIASVAAELTQYMVAEIAGFTVEKAKAEKAVRAELEGAK